MQDVNTLTNTVNWFKLAVPNPKNRNFVVQLGAALEEVCELLDALGLPSAELHQTSAALYEGDYDTYLEATFCTQTADHPKKEAVLDALADITVTTAGCAYMLGQDFVGAMKEVNASNWSKFNDGVPVFNESGKITKGEGYFTPDLKPYLGNREPSLDGDIPMIGRVNESETDEGVSVP